MAKLSEIAEIKAGYSFRNAVSSIENGDLPVIQFKDVNSLELKDLSKCALISSQKIKDSSLLKYNDILLSNRGNYKSTVFKSDKKCIASGVFFIIKVKNKKILPEYISTFLNLSEGQKVLYGIENKSGVNAITKSALEQIDIPLIPLKKQKNLIDLFLIYEKEINIMENIKKSKKQLINIILNKTIKE